MLMNHANTFFLHAVAREKRVNLVGICFGGTERRKYCEDNKINKELE
jgi:hypothetical protein